MEMGLATNFVCSRISMSIDLPTTLFLEIVPQNAAKLCIKIWLQVTRFFFEEKKNGEQVATLYVQV